MLAGTRSFIDQISKMVGPEPMESSHGDVTLLPTYVVSHTHFIILYKLIYLPGNHNTVTMSTMFILLKVLMVFIT